MDNIFDLLFGSLYDKAILKIKRMRARIILRRSRADLDWFNDYKQDPRYMKAILFDENLLNLFIDKAYRKYGFTTYGEYAGFVAIHETLHVGKMEEMLRVIRREFG